MKPSCVVFVVDDGPQLADTLSVILRQAGCQVFTFYDGVEVLSHVPEVPPDVVVTDFVMPKVNGAVLASWLLEHYPQCRIVMMSGNDPCSSILPDELKNIAGITMLHKPFRAKDLIAIVSSAM